MIDSYHFGRIGIAGQTYHHDVLILPERVLKWWRKEGHRLCVEDLAEVLECSPELVVIGTGMWGMMEVPASVTESLRARGIEPLVSRTGSAWKTFNECLSQGKRVVGAFHLTC